MEGKSTIPHTPQLHESNYYYTATSEFLQLQTMACNFHSKPKYHLRELLLDTERCDGLLVVHSTSTNHVHEDRNNSVENKDIKMREASNLISKHSKRSITLDYSRQQVTGKTMDLLFQYADKLQLSHKISLLHKGVHKLNHSEERRVLHFVLRMPKDYPCDIKDDQNEKMKVLDEVHAVRFHVDSFSQRVRKGEYRGVSGKELKSVVCVGIGGSQLGPQCVYESLRTHEASLQASKGRTLRFLANVDPVDFRLQTSDLDPSETLIIVVSKTFTTVETMLNAKTCKAWLCQSLSQEKYSQNEIIQQHMIAVSTVTTPCLEFGISQTNIFPFWPWVGGRFSVTSAVGILPLSIHYGPDIINEFLQGAHDMDEHFFHMSPRENIPIVLGLLGVWNSTFMKYGSRVVLPYSQALSKFPAHIQQVEMESNGKRVSGTGETLKYYCGEIVWGECGTNGQHSFYQLLHQGRVVPGEFIGFVRPSVGSMEDVNTETTYEMINGEDEEGKLEEDISQIPDNTSDITTSYNFNTPIPTSSVDENIMTQHDELMANFFAQPDALAYGKTLSDLQDEGVPEHIRPHNVFPGNRPSSTLLLTQCDAFAMGQLIALYEHRTTVQGFLWDINSFDQWGVQLGKTLAKRVRDQFVKTRKKQKADHGRSGSTMVQGFNSSTSSLLTQYLNES